MTDISDHKRRPHEIVVVCGSIEGTSDSFDEVSFEVSCFAWECSCIVVEVEIEEARF